MQMMRDTLTYLTYLDPNDMEAIMQDKLAKQMNGMEWSWENLNKLCWAMGAISGAMGLFAFLPTFHFFFLVFS